MDIAVRLLLWLRYRFHVEGLEELRARGTRSILFLPNHPALIDPVMIVTVLWRHFRARPLGIRETMAWAPARPIARYLRAILMPDPALADRHARQEVLDALERCAELLERGDNLVVWPSGRLATSRYEELAGNFAAAALAERVAQARLVLVRISGLWGSRFSRARGGELEGVNSLLWRGGLAALASALVLMPRRAVRIRFEEGVKLPPPADRAAFNRALEEWYNREAAPGQALALTPWTWPRRWELPEPPQQGFAGDLAAVTPELRARVEQRLADLSGVGELDDELHLARDLGLDSLQRAELGDWLQQELGCATPNPDHLRSVRDLLLAASGAGNVGLVTSSLEAPAEWFTRAPKRFPSLAPGTTLCEAFVAAAERAPAQPAVADLASGVRSYRRILVGIAALSPLIRALPGGPYVGLMMPASVGADVLYLAALFAGRIPVMVNWTTGSRNVRHGLELLGVERVLTARALVQRLAPLGVDFAPYAERFVYVEDLAPQIGAVAKLRALLEARAPRRLVPELDPERPAVVLFTSGSETRPKAVPLSHRNLLNNLADIGRWVPFEPHDRLLSILPPFHSFGLTAGMLMPLLFGFPAVHHANPRESTLLVELVQAFGATLMGGTPTFLEAMLRQAGPGQLSSLRLAVTGGESCPKSVFSSFARICPNAEILEGYGVTECSPIVAINRPGRGRVGSVGQVLPSFEHRILVPEEPRVVAAGEMGRLVVTGPSVFSGYLGEGAPDPFVQVEGRSWYDTGDLVLEDAEGYLSIRGRLRRFLKIGGEMVSLPAIEEVLCEALDRHRAAAGEGPAAAVVAAGDQTESEITLVSTVEIDRAGANAILRRAGLSPIHSIARVRLVPEIPVLGTGKTDHRTLVRTLEAAPPA